MRCFSVSYCCFIFFFSIHLVLQLICLLFFSSRISAAYFSLYLYSYSRYLTFLSYDSLENRSFSDYGSCFHSSDAAFVTYEMLLMLYLAAIFALFQCRKSRYEEVGALGLQAVKRGFILGLPFFFVLLGSSAYLINDFASVQKGSTDRANCIISSSQSLLLSLFCLSFSTLTLSSLRQNQVSDRKKLALSEANLCIYITKSLTKLLSYCISCPSVVLLT